MFFRGRNSLPGISRLDLAIARRKNVTVTVHFSIRGLTEEPMSGGEGPRPRLVDAISLAE
jgi:hypothetical protein